MLAIKLALVAASVLLSTLAARRFGHAVGGAVAGMPMIAAPITAILLIDHGAEQVRGIALATLACLPAAVAHIVTMARAASTLPWGACLALALAVFGLAGGLLTQWSLAAPAVCVLALAAPGLGLLAMPQGLAVHASVAVPRTEIVLRIAAALVMAAVVIAGADALPPSISGLLLAVPITGSVLPCFTLPRHGAAATVSLMRGFARGLHGFAAFFVTLYFALGWVDRASAFGIALLASLGAALLVQGLARLHRQSGRWKLP